MTDTSKNADFYKETVFLPKTEFPMRGGLAKKEPEILKQWQDMDLYKRQREASKDRPKWILHWGPPYANGHAHIGHAFTKSLKDVVNRSWQMMGYDAPLVPGWDCHGLPIEWKIEEQYRAKGKDKDEVDPLVFRKECREFARKWVDIQSEEFQRLGVIADFEDPYLTMTNRAEASIVREIHKFLLNGSLYKGVKPVMWSVVEKTALAEAEVEYKEHKSVTVWIKFPVKETNCAAIKDASIVIWTTTPWTLPSNRAVAYGADLEYAVYEIKAVAESSRAQVGDKIVLCTALADDVKEKAKIENWTRGDTFNGKEIAGTICRHPLHAAGYDFDVPALEADFVTADAGTGVVHIAPSHGADDFYLGKEAGLEITDNVTDDGKFKDHVPLFAGMEVYTDKGEMGGGNFAVLKEMNEVGALLAKGSLRHEYPHSWRSKAPLIFRTTPQWFIAMDDDNNIREKALEEIKKVRWVPSQGENRITAMIAQRPDWCISRQRAWGVPIALFLDKTTGEPLKDEAVLARINEIFVEEGSDSWWARPAQDFLGDKYNADDYDQVFDVVDVWFESGCSHSFVVEDRDELQWPADLYLEGSDQHRGWFHSSLLESCGTRGQAPYKAVLTHGFVLDEKGYKMSKSLGNVVDPFKMINQYGADILRLWSITSDYGDDLRIGKDAMKSSSDLYRRIRNTLRFLLGALADFTKNESIEFFDTPESLPELEQYILHRVYETDRKIRSHIENYQFGKVAKLLHDFCNEDLSALYFDIRKDRLYCDREDQFERRACRTVMAVLFNGLTSWLAPILCFTAEEAWSHRPKGVFEDVESVHLRTFPDVPDVWQNEELAERWSHILKIRRAVLGALEPKRADKTIGSSLEAHPVVYLNEDYREALGSEDLAEICIVSQVTISNGDGPEDAFRLNDVKGISVVFGRAEGNKCLRCWKILPEVGSDPDYPDLTLRDADAVRWYVKNSKAA